MPRAEDQTKPIFGIFDPGGEQVLLDANCPGWVLFAEEIGCDPNDRSSKDYSAFREIGLTVVVRLVNGRYPDGTLPPASHYGNFARRCANFVAESRGCHHWIIGNEMNYAVERPNADDLLKGIAAAAEAMRQGDPFLRGLPHRHDALHPSLGANEREMERFRDGGEIITPERYARCFRLCREAIQRVTGHESDRVMVGAVAPWNTHTTYPGNPQGDWIKYFQDILLLLGSNNCDGITLHTQTHGSDPNLISDDSRLSAFPEYAYHFQVYRDFLAAVPTNMRHLPIFITEADQGQPWEDANTGWIQAAYAEIEHWNQQPDHQQIDALFLYRWQPIDAWHIEGKRGVIADLRAALHKAHGEPQQEAASGPSPAETTAPQAEPPTRTGGPAYRVQWLQSRLPKPLFAGDVVTVPLTVRNIGVATWPHEGPNPVRLGYRFYRNKEEVRMPPDRQLHTPLPHDVAPEESVSLQAHIALPEEEGNYTLVIDMIHEGVTWFADQQSDVLMRWLTVLPREEEPEERGETERTREPESESVGAFDPQAGADRTEAPVPQVSAPRPVEFARRPPAVTERPAPPPVGETPEIVNVVATLPRGNKTHHRRPLSAVRYIVINHTGAPPVVPLHTIAQAHIDAGYPGITYHYVVAADGTVLQVGGLENVVSREEWAQAGVHVALEGVFHEEPPPHEQLDAAARLCVHLIKEMATLTVEDVVGLCELIPSTSPGVAFVEGPTWRRLLRERIQLHLGEPPRVAASAAPARPPVPKPYIEDVTASLPRRPDQFYSRTPEDIRSIVINHTGVDPDVPLDVIAEGFQERGLPGILYQYVIAEDGSIFQTQPLLQVVDGDRPYIANAINVAFAGNFDETVPPPAQIEAGGALLAWLLWQHPQISIDDIKGVSELIAHNSPGEQWLRGRRWKERLLQAVEEAPRRERVVVKTVVDEETRQQMQTLAHEHQRLQLQAHTLQRENERLRREVEALRAEPEQVRRVPEPDVVDQVEQLPRHPSLRYERRRLDAITRIAVHHTGVPPYVGPDRIAATHVQEDPERGKEAWPGIGYHFFVQVDGRIVRTQPLGAVTYHVAGHNDTTVGVAFAGSFLNGEIPTEAQIRGGGHLIAWLLQELRLPLECVWGHQEFDGNDTVCPGSEWLQGKRWRDLLYDEIVRWQKGESQPS